MKRTNQDRELQLTDLEPQPLTDEQLATVLGGCPDVCGTAGTEDPKAGICIEDTVCHK